MFTKNEFSRIWEQLLFKLIDEKAKQLGIKHKPMKIVEFLMFFHYERLRRKIIKHYMVDNTSRIDRHKIASCMMKTILIVKPLYVPLKIKLKYIFSKNTSLGEVIRSSSDKNLKFMDDKFYIFLNEYLAIYAAVHILNAYIKADDSKYHHKIVIPEPFPVPDMDYLLDVCMGIGYSKIKHCSTITFANVFFLWEKYSCRKSRCDSLAAAYKELLSEHSKLLGKTTTENELNVEVEKAMYAEQFDRIKNNQEADKS